MHAQLERAQAKVDAEHVVERAIRPRLIENRGDPFFVGIVLLREGGLDHTAKVHADDAGDPAEEREPDEEVERERQLRLRHVIGITQKAPVVEPEPAQVVERAQEEMSPELVALRVSQRGTRGDLRPREKPDGVDPVGLRVGEEAVRAALRE